MIPGAIKAVRLVDRLIARWEVSIQASMPLMLSNMALVLLFVGFAVIVKATGTAQTYVGRTLFAAWIVLAVLDGLRFLWTVRHPYATPRWLRAVHRSVGDDVAVHALAELMRRHDHDPDYVVRRFDMIAAVQNERERRREAKRRAEGFRLAEAPAPAQPDPQALADAERRRCARERRAARQARKTA